MKSLSKICKKKTSSNQEYLMPKWLMPVVTKASPTNSTTVAEATDPIKKMNGSSKLPHNCEIILKDADPPIALSSLNLSEQLRSGVFLKPTKLVGILFPKKELTKHHSTFI